MPKPIENWFLGSQEDEKFLKTKQDKTPTYEQLNNDYQNGAISKEEYTTGIQQRSKLNRIQADREYTDARNLNIGKGVIDVGTVPVQGPASLSKMVGTKVLPNVVKVLPKALPKITKGTRHEVAKAAVDLTTSTAASTAGHMAIDPDAKFKDKFKSSAKDSVRNYAIDKTIRGIASLLFGIK